MPKVEIEESELAELVRVNKFATAALNNPKTRKQLLAIDKTLNPEKAIPELDAADGVMGAVNEVKEMVLSFKKDLEDRDTKDAETRRTSELQGRVSKGQEYLTANGYNVDGIKKVEELMLQENISSYAAGLALFERINPPAEPLDSTRVTPFGSVSENNMSDTTMKELWDSQGLSDKWLNDAINGARRDFRGRN